ncbi:MAG: aminomethyltransferase beta-barrel domain-containing protein, partial [Spongiibacter sp.]|nr:aminomethyltransferase beta-barrel domain-containing protein [Spongiibacter sp.]
PWYVVEKDLQRNVLVVTQGSQHPALFKNCLSLSSIHWIDGQEPELPLRCQAKTRYRQQDQDCELIATNAGYELRFDEPQRAVTPGQSAVLYLGEHCLGGGIIEAGHNR